MDEHHLSCYHKILFLTHNIGKSSRGSKPGCNGRYRLGSNLGYPASHLCDFGHMLESNHFLTPLLMVKYVILNRFKTWNHIAIYSFSTLFLKMALFKCNFITKSSTNYSILLHVQSCSGWLFFCGFQRYEMALSC